MHIKCILTEIVYGLSPFSHLTPWVTPETRAPVKGHVFLNLIYCTYENYRFADSSVRYQVTFVTSHLGCAALSSCDRSNTRNALVTEAWNRQRGCTSVTNTGNTRHALERQEM